MFPKGIVMFCLQNVGKAHAQRQLKMVGVEGFFTASSLRKFF